MSIEIIISGTPLKTGLHEMTFEEEITIKAEIAIDVKTGEARLRISPADEAFKEKAAQCLVDAGDEI